MGHSSAVAWCGFYGAGAIVTLLLYGLFQEEIMTQPYDGERFRFTSLLVFLNRCMNATFALIMILVLRQPLIRKAPLKNYVVVCAASVLATTCQYESLKYVSFPVQMMGKSFKMAPVMWWGMLIARKRYGVLDWVTAATVTGGTVLFLTTGQISAPDAHNSFWGLFLLLVFLACDGFACSMQEKLFKDYEATKYNQMFYLNFGSAIISFICMFADEHVGPAFAFAKAHPGFVQDAMILSSTAVASQFFIYSQVTEFGAFVLAATMNLRQIGSIVVSCLRYNHSLTRWQMLGLDLVFGSILYRSYATYINYSSAEREPLVSKSETEPLISNSAGGLPKGQDRDMKSGLV